MEVQVLSTAKFNFFSGKNLFPLYTLLPSCTPLHTSHFIFTLKQLIAAAEISIRREGDEAVVSVRDHGTGIIESELERIFERFHQTQARKRAGHGGTGLGLAISREIVHAHGGTIVAANHPERGAVFTARLPIRSVPQAKSRDAA